MNNRQSKSFRISAALRSEITGASDVIPFEVKGYFEEFIDASTYRFLGIRFLDSPGQRQLGSSGMITRTLIEPLQLLKGYKRIPVTIKSGTRVICMVQAICGRQRK
jgi:hypothetical protein